MTWLHIIETLLAVSFTWLVFWFFAPEAKAQDIVWHGYMPPVSVEFAILAIADVENWDGKSIGKAGERGRLQFTKARWGQLSTKPFRWADSRQNFAIKETHRVERAHIVDLIEQCKKIHRRPTAYLVAAFHTAGFTAVSSGHIQAFKKDFAERVAIVYYQLATDP